MTCLLLAAAFMLAEWKVVEKRKTEKIPAKYIADFSQIIPSEALYLIRVIYGDTIVVSGQNGKFNVRLLGIDAPEKKQNNEHKAVSELSFLISQQPITLKTTSKDVYDRILSHVHAEGTLVNMEMSKLGAAMAYRSITDAFLDDFNKSERNANINQRWLLADRNPIFIREITDYADAI